MPLLTVNDIETLEPVLDGREDAIIFKHSTRCPISRRARTEVVAFAKSTTDVTIHEVLVVEHRPVSLAIADRTGVAHASPQALLLRGGRVVWHDSHLAITANALTAAWIAGAGGAPTP